MEVIDEKVEVEGFTNAIHTKVKANFNSNSSSTKTIGDDYISKETRDRSYNTLDNDNAQNCSNSPCIFIQQNPN
jgi:hypothetical protein